MWWHLLAGGIGFLLGAGCILVLMMFYLPTWDD